MCFSSALLLHCVCYKQPPPPRFYFKKEQLHLSQHSTNSLIPSPSAENSVLTTQPEGTGRIPSSHPEAKDLGAESCTPTFHREVDLKGPYGLQRGLRVGLGPGTVERRGNPLPPEQQCSLDIPCHPACNQLRCHLLPEAFPEPPRPPPLGHHQLLKQGPCFLLLHLHSPGTQPSPWHTE